MRRFKTRHPRSHCHLNPPSNFADRCSSRLVNLPRPPPQGHACRTLAVDESLRRALIRKGIFRKHQEQEQLHQGFGLRRWLWVSTYNWVHGTSAERCTFLCLACCDGLSCSSCSMLPRPLKKIWAIFVKMARRCLVRCKFTIKITFSSRHSTH